jgi:hypothetical protein
VSTAILPLAGESGAADAARTRLYFRVLAAAVPVAAVLLVAFHPPSLTETQALLAAAVGVMGCVPGLLYLRGGAAEPFPLLPLNSLFYSLGFGFSAFFPTLDWMGSSPDAITKALWLTLAALGALYAGYALGRPLVARLRPVHIPMAASPGRLRAFAWGFCAVHLVFLYVPRVARIPSLEHLLEPLGWLAMGLLFLQYLRGRLPLAEAVLFFGVALPAELFSRLLTGLLYDVGLVFAFLGLAYWRERRRVPWLAGVLLAALFLSLNPVKFGYRGAVKMMPENASPAEKAKAFLAMTASYYTGRTERVTEEAVGSSVGRVGLLLAIFARVVDLTPETVPYWGGETYVYFASGLVPRALWSDKPNAAFGNEFGHRYGVLHPGVYDTSVNVPWLVEFYMNFGPAAVPVGMLLVGLGLRLLARKLDNPRANDCEYVLGLTLCFQLCWAESNLALMWGGLLQTALALYVVLNLAARRVRW